MSLGCPLVPMWGYDLLVWIILWTGKDLKLTSQGEAGIAPVPFNEECFLARGPQLWEQIGEENLKVGSLRLSVLPDVEATHNTGP